MEDVERSTYFSTAKKKDIGIYNIKLFNDLMTELKDDTLWDERQEKIKVIERQSMLEVLDKLSKFGIWRGSCSWFHYSDAKKIIFEDLWINSRIYELQIDWIVNYIFPFDKEVISLCQYRCQEKREWTNNIEWCNEYFDYSEYMKPCNPGSKDCLINLEIAQAQYSQMITDEKYKFAGYASYQEYLQSPHWLKIRQQALEHYDNACALDKSHTVHLNVHHNNYANLGKETLRDVIVLCKECHERHHMVEM